LFPPAAASNRNAGSPAHGFLTFFTTGIRVTAATVGGSRRDDSSVEVDQPRAVGDWKANADQP
jgi:hypothetical protein